MLRLVVFVIFFFFVGEIVYCSASLEQEESLEVRKARVEQCIAKMKHQNLLRALSACNAHFESSSLTSDDLALNEFSKSLLVRRINSFYF